MLTSRPLLALLAAGLLCPRAALAQDKPNPATPAPLRYTLAPEALIGGTARVGDSATGYELDERAAINYALGLYLGIGRRFDVGAQYFHTGIGVETESRVAAGAGVESRRTMDSALLDLRFFAFRNDWAGLFLGLNAGLSWQSVDHSATQVAQPESSPVFSRVSCQASASPRAALGVGVGADFDLDTGASFILRGSGLTNQLSGDTIGDCAAGAGTTNLLLLQAGFRYRFDLGGGKAAR